MPCAAGRALQQPMPWLAPPSNESSYLVLVQCNTGTEEAVAEPLPAQLLYEVVFTCVALYAVLGLCVSDVSWKDLQWVQVALPCNPLGGPKAEAVFAVRPRPPAGQALF